MNELFEFNSDVVQEWLEKEGRKIAWLRKKIGASQSLMDKMLYYRHVPKAQTLRSVAEVIGIEEHQLLIPRKKRKTA